MGRPKGSKQTQGTKDKIRKALAAALQRRRMRLGRAQAIPQGELETYDNPFVLQQLARRTVGAALRVIGLTIETGEELVKGVSPRFALELALTGQTVRQVAGYADRMPGPQVQVLQLFGAGPGHSNGSGDHPRLPSAQELVDASRLAEAIDNPQVNVLGGLQADHSPPPTDRSVGPQPDLILLPAPTTMGGGQAVGAPSMQDPDQDKH